MKSPRRLWPAVLAAALFVWAGTAAAMETVLFDFREGKTNADWQALGPIGVERVPDGLLLSTGPATGALLTDTELPWLAHAGRLLSSSPAGAEIKFVWAFYEDEDPQTYSMNVDVPVDSLAVTSFDLSGSKRWREGGKRIGLALPPNTTVLVSTLEFARWNAFEHLAETSAAFWWMDQYRPYSINFTWGPQWATNPVMRQHAYMNPPPTTVSTTYILFWALAVLTGAAFAWYAFGGRTPWKRRRALLVAGAGFAAVWLLLDVRMGMEFLTWVQHDHATYVSGQEPNRTFRDRDNFYDFAAFAAPLVADRENYLFFAEREWPYLGNIRYITYPSVPGNGFDTDDTWVVYRRPDIAPDAEGRLTLDGKVVSPPGIMLGKFEEGSFVYRVILPPPAPAAP